MYYFSYTQKQNPFNAHLRESSVNLMLYVLYFQLVSSDTWFELRLIRFENPTGRESDGDCCDFPCSDPCDPDIVVCIDKPWVFSKIQIVCVMLFKLCIRSIYCCCEYVVCSTSYHSFVWK